MFARSEAREGKYEVCAIFGIIGEYEQKEAMRAFELLRHRGVDGSSYMAECGLFMGSHRLAITTYGEPMAQPLVSESTLLLFNGEIYNYKTLAAELGKEEASEAEVLLMGYRRWGRELPSRINGMYAVAIWDGGRLLLFRDPFGKKPLFYRFENGVFSFASESKALVRDGDRMDPEAIPCYLSYQAPLAPRTFYAGIRQLGAGEMLVYDMKTITLSQTYSPLKAPRLHQRETEIVSLIENALKEAVRLRIPQKVPFAALLSGGIDSSLVAAMAAKEGAVATYCIGYEGHEKYDERGYAREVAAHIGSAHNEVVLTKEGFFESINELLNVLDEPLADPAAIPLYFLMKRIAKSGYRVVLTGDGSDELFMGYKRYYEFADIEKGARLKHTNWLTNYFRSNFSPNKEWEWYKRVFEGSLLFRGTAEIFTDLQQNRALRQNIRDNNSLTAIEPYRREFEQSGRKDAADWYSFLDLKILLGEVFLKKLDRVSMVNGIEARTPFLDRGVVEIAFGIDGKTRMGVTPKHLIKKLAASYLPPTIIHRKKKGFSTPYLEWLLEENGLGVIERVQKERGIFHEEQIRFYLEKAKQGHFKQHIFSLYMLCKWLETKEGES